MQSYTTLLQAQLDDISPDDENFIDELLEVSKLFRCKEPTTVELPG